MNEKPRLEAWSAAFFLAALAVGVVLALPDEGCERKRTRPSLAAELERTEASATQGLILTDLEGWTQTPHPESKPELLTRQTLDLDAAGQASVGPLESGVAWRGIRFPHTTKPQHPLVSDLREVRIKLLLYQGLDPVDEPGPGVRVVLKTGDRVHANFAALAEAVASFAPEVRLLLDARAGVPARHVVTALAILCRSKRAFLIAAGVSPGRLRQIPSALREGLDRAVASVTKDERGLPQLGLRIRPDARCSWGAIQGVLDAALARSISRVTLSGNAGELEVDLFQAGPLDPGAREEPAAVPEKPIIILEEEVEVPAPEEGVEVPGSERGVNPPVRPRDPLSAPATSPSPSFPERAARARATPESEAAVKAALGWLKRHQRPDGSWRAEGNGCCDGPQEPGDARFDVSVTSLALLAYLGTGHTHRYGVFKRVVRQGLFRLRRLQADEGSIGVSAEHPASAYNHAYATQALCEAYATTRDFTLKLYARKAVGWILATQVPEEGRAAAGWITERGAPRCDPILTCAMTRALLAAKTAGIEVPAPALGKALACLGSPGPSSGGPAARGPRAEGKFDRLPSAAASSAFTRLQAGSDAAAALREAGLLLEAPPLWDRAQRKVDFYYWYAGSHALFQIGGKPYATWLSALRQALLPHQETSASRAGPCAAGSWAPRAELGHLGGRTYATALGALALEVPYRYERAPR